MAVKKRPAQTCSTQKGHYKYFVKDILIRFQENQVWIEVYSNAVKLTEMTVNFNDPTLESMHEAIKNRIEKEAVRLSMLKEVVGEMFDG